MSPEKTIVLNAVKKWPKSTGGEIWRLLLETAETRADKRMIRSLFKFEDHTVRQVLSVLKQSSLVDCEIRSGTVLNEWRVGEVQ